MSEGVKNFFNNHGKDIAMGAVFLVSAYFAIQTNTSDIAHNTEKIKELEKHKVSNSTMILKEQFLQSELIGIENQFKSLKIKLNKKSLLIAAQQTQTHLLTVQLAVQQAQINQGINERGNIWQNYNRINCK